jgi:enediyne biosynthesis protein E4
VLLGPEELSADFLKPMVGRGIATADIDGDGDLDLLLTANRHRPRLLRNDRDNSHHWVRVRVTQPQGLREALGTVVMVKTGATTQRQVVQPMRGYLSQSELTLTFGLGTATTIDELKVVWPDGREELVAEPRVDALNVVERATP